MLRCVVDFDVGAVVAVVVAAVVAAVGAVVAVVDSVCCLIGVISFVVSR